ncbi:MAG TPA: penicillin acylase family protein [Vicinamibacterales bacterium]|nr:penicillin acylase family protein [Vicinamibacterales bacterium]
MPRRSILLLLATTLTATGVVGCNRQLAFPEPDALAQHVTIRRDTYGIPHILADSEEAAAFGFGYAQAEDHAEEIGRRYISARGEGARYFGDSGLAGDIAMAQFDNLAEARRGLDRITPLYRRVIAAYAAGVNRYVTRHRTELPDWMPTITAADVLASTRASAAESLGGAALLRRLREKYEGVPARGGEDEENAWIDQPGSNALALAGSRTSTGKPILLGNPHLQWSSLYWEAHVRVPGKIDFYGSSLPGIPVLRAGFNDRLGFVTTNNAPDLDDVFALSMDPQRPDHYLFDGSSMPLRARNTVVQVRNPDGSMRAESRVFWSSHIGEVIYRTANRAFVVKSSRLDALQYFGGFYELSKARTLKNWMAALRLNYVPTSNFTYADVDGNILYFWNSRLPVRKDGVDYRLDTPAASTGDVWSRLHGIDDFPRLLNPPGGYVQNANNPPRFVSTADPIDMSRYPAHVERGQLALRPQLSLDMLESRRTFSVDDVMRLKYSNRMLLAERIKADVIAAVRATPGAGDDARAGADALEAWDDMVSAGSRGAVLFQRFWELYTAAVRAPFLTPWDEANPLKTPAGLSDRAAAVTHLATAVRGVREEHGSERVAWGDVHRFRAGALDLPGDGASGAYGTYRVMTFEPATGTGAGGAPANAFRKPVRVAGYVPGRSAPVGFGDAWILLVDFSRPGTAWSVLAYGQTTKRDSPHSSDQLQLFADHKLRPVWFSESDIRAHTQRTYRP